MRDFPCDKYISDHSRQRLIKFDLLRFDRSRPLKSFAHYSRNMNLERINAHEINIINTRFKQNKQNEFKDFAVLK